MPPRPISRTIRHDPTLRTIAGEMTTGAGRTQAPSCKPGIFWVFDATGRIERVTGLATRHARSARLARILSHPASVHKKFSAALTLRGPHCSGSNRQDSRPTRAPGGDRPAFSEEA